MTSDPRVFFASERTMLAWLRTGIAMIGLGFVVSRFGLFVRLLAAQTSIGHIPAPGHDHANWLGIALVLLGALSIVGASVQHGRFIATLPEIDRPAAYSRTWALWLGGMVALASLVLAAYLWLTA